VGILEYLNHDGKVTMVDMRKDVFVHAYMFLSMNIKYVYLHNLLDHSWCGYLRIPEPRWESHDGGHA
jgi:hypothetical protein